MVKRSAFTLIELIFAIVIIAITVLTLPMMSRVTAKGIENSIVQEAIFAAATELNEATTYHWDANSINPATPNSYAKVIDINGSCDDNTSSPRYRLLPGQIEQPLHRRCLDSNATIPADANSATVETVENAAHNYRLIFLNPTPNKEGYKNEYKSMVTVGKKATFGDLNNSKNIKPIQVTIKNSDGTILTSLKTYVTNIGETDYYKKAY
ncbi:type II secretion system protein [Sulfurimonas sp.]|uniref:type II secretion system protein n=1 Tax=Sulfurimonas sp. TaxID=2022749 RepID=UPI0026364C54|nr:type II secretion system protein [Sulfurimonas sp.]